MKNMTSEGDNPESAELLPEYDFSGGVRGKHNVAYREGHTVEVHKADGTIDVRYFTLEDGAVLLEPDVREYFPDSEAVNKTLRTLISLVPEKNRGSQRVANRAPRLVSQQPMTGDAPRWLRGHPRRPR